MMAQGEDSTMVVSPYRYNCNGFNGGSPASSRWFLSSLPPCLKSVCALSMARLESSLVGMVSLSKPSNSDVKLRARGRLYCAVLAQDPTTA